MPLTVPQTGNSFALQSSISELAGPDYAYAGHTGVTLDPARTFDPTFTFLMQAGLAVNKNILLLFGATPVTPPAGQPVTSWSLSEVPVLYRSNFSAETLLHCAKAGSYRISSTEPIAHGIELTDVSDVARCPGQPIGQPVVVRFQ